MRELLGAGYHSKVYRLEIRDDVVIKFNRFPLLRTRENELGEMAYQKADMELNLLADYLGWQHLLRTRVRVGPYGLWWIEQEKLPDNYFIPSSDPDRSTDKGSLQEMATKAKEMKVKTGLGLDWWGLESVKRIDFIRRAAQDQNFWILPNLRVVPDENGVGQVKIVDTGLIATRIPLNIDRSLIYSPHEPLVYSLQEALLKIVEKRSGIVF